MNIIVATSNKCTSAYVDFENFNNHPLCALFSKLWKCFVFWVDSMQLWTVPQVLHKMLLSIHSCTIRDTSLSDIIKKISVNAT